MIGHAQIGKAASDAGFDQFANGVLPIAPNGVDVQDAAQVALRDQLGSCPLAAASIRPCPRAVPARCSPDRALCRGLPLRGQYELKVGLFATEQAVIVDGHVREGAATQGDMVLLGTAEVVQRGGKLAVIDDAQVHRDAIIQTTLDLVGPLPVTLTTEGWL